MAKVQIKRMGVFSCAKIYSITLAAMGLIVGVIYGLIFMVVGGAMMAGGGRDAGTVGVSSLVAGLLMMVVLMITAYATFDTAIAAWEHGAGSSRTSRMVPSPITSIQNDFRSAPLVNNSPARTASQSAATTAGRS